MRVLYNLTTYLLLLPYAIYWMVRVTFNKTYRAKLGQRFGFNYPKFEECIWIHAVSVGEVVAAAPLVRALLRYYPRTTLLVSTVTPTGAARVHSLFGDRVEHCYIPFEVPFSINRFYRSVRPVIALIMETEIWPNLYRGCGVRGIPLVLVSARISPRSVGSYRRLLPLFRETLSHGIVIAAQSAADAERFLSLAANPERTRVTGNIKFDIELPPDLAERGAALRTEVFGDRPVWIAASTHDREEEMVLTAHDSLRQALPDLLLVLVPRHPERFSMVREILQKRQTAFVTRTGGMPCSADTSVFLGDTMGEVTLFYAASDVAFVGGSLVAVGGHNLLEPAAVGVPIVTGPYVFNAQETADYLVSASACRILQDETELADAILELFQNPEMAKSFTVNGRQILEENRGALGRLLGLIRPLIKTKHD